MMTSIRIPACVLSACLGIAMLSACGSSERDRIADRIESEISPAQTADPVERRQVAEAMADDAMALGREAKEVAAAQEAATRAIEARVGTPEDAMARECAELRLQLEALQRPSSEIRTPEETAGIPAEIERLQARIRQNC